MKLKCFFGSTTCSTVKFSVVRQHLMSCCATAELSRTCYVHGHCRNLGHFTDDHGITELSRIHGRGGGRGRGRYFGLRIHTVSLTYMLPFTDIAEYISGNLHGFTKVKELSRIQGRIMEISRIRRTFTDSQTF